MDRDAVVQLGQNKSILGMPFVPNAAEQLTMAIQALHRRGWCDGTGGNFSMVVNRSPLRLLMAPSGIDKGEVGPESLIEVDGEGAVLQGTGLASAETRLHLQVIHDCGAGAVLHTHSPAATLLSRLYLSEGCLVLAGWEMLKGLAGIRTHDTSVRLPIIENNQDLKVLSSKASQLLPTPAHGLLVSGHGLYAWGKDLTEARRHVEILEFLLDLTWRQCLLQKR